MLTALAKIIKRKLAPQVTLSIETLDTEKELLPETLILHACFQTLVNYIEGPARYKDVKENYRDVNSLYQYWKEERPKLLFEEQQYHEEGDRFNSGRMERKRQQLDQDKLLQLVKIRKKLKF